MLLKSSDYLSSTATITGYLFVVGLPSYKDYQQGVKAVKQPPLCSRPAAKKHRLRYNGDHASPSSIKTNIAMFSWWRKGDGAIRLADDDLFFDEKLIVEDDKHALLDDEPLSDSDIIQQNLEHLNLLDPVVTEDLFLAAKKQRGSICLEDQVARPSQETAWRIISRILISDSPASWFSLLLHVFATALALVGRWHLYRALLNLEEHKDEGPLNAYTNRCGAEICEWHWTTWNENVYDQFYEYGDGDVNAVVRFPPFHS